MPTLLHKSLTKVGNLIKLRHYDLVTQYETRLTKYNGTEVKVMLNLRSIARFHPKVDFRPVVIEPKLSLSYADWISFERKSIILVGCFEFPISNFNFFIKSPACLNVIALLSSGRLTTDNMMIVEVTSWCFVKCCLLSF